MDETLKSVRAAYYVLLTVCGTLALFGVSAAANTPFRRALREVDELQRIPWASLGDPDSLRAFAGQRAARRGASAEDARPLAEVLLHRVGRVETGPDGRLLVTLDVDRIYAIDTLFLVDHQLEVEMAGASSDGPGSRLEIAPPPADAPLAAYEAYLRGNPAFLSAIPATRYKAATTSASHSGFDMKNLCRDLPRRCVLYDLRAMRDTAGSFKLFAKVRGLNDPSAAMEMTFFASTAPTGLRLADWLARDPRAARLLDARAGRGGGLVFLPALRDLWPEVQGLTLGQARLLLASKVRAAEQTVDVLGLDVPGSAVAVAGPGVLLALLAHLGLLLRHLRGLARTGDVEPLCQFPLPLLFPGAPGTLAAILAALVLPAAALAMLSRRVAMDGMDRAAFWAGGIAVLVLGFRVVMQLAAIRRQARQAGRVAAVASPAPEAPPAAEPRLRAKAGHP